MVAYHLDFETTSAANLKTAGVYRYAEHETTRVVLFAYQRNDEGVHLFHPGRDAIPDDLLDHIRAGGIVKAHNSSFERIIWNRVLRRQFPDWPELAVEQMDCTMARACALGLPADRVVQEYMDGGDLAVGTDLLAVSRVLEVGKDVASALAFIHRATVDYLPALLPAAEAKIALLPSVLP